MSNWIGFVAGLAVVGWVLFILLAATTIVIYRVHKSHNRVCRKNKREVALLQTRNHEMKEVCTTLLTMIYDLVLTEDKSDIVYKAGVIRSTLFLDGMITHSDYSVESLQAILATMDTADVDDIVTLVMRIANRTYNFDPENITNASSPETLSALDKFLRTLDTFFETEQREEVKLRCAEAAVRQDRNYQDVRNIQIKQSTRATEMLTLMQ